MARRRGRFRGEGPTPRDRLIALGGLIAIVSVAVVALWAAGILGNQAGGEGIEDVTLLDPPPAGAAGDLDVGVREGDLAQDFEISDFDGARHKLSDFRGQVVYVNFWATWCVPCQAELPDMAALQEEYGDDLIVIAVNRTEPLDRAEAFFRDLPRLDGGTGVDFPVNGMDPDDTLFNEFVRVGAMPSSIFVDPDGVISRVSYGEIRLEQMQEAVNEALTG